jgi:hypothetical protein
MATDTIRLARPIHACLEMTAMMIRLAIPNAQDFTSYALRKKNFALLPHQNALYAYILPKRKWAATMASTMTATATWIREEYLHFWLMSPNVLMAHASANRLILPAML